ncbi:oxygen-independent coproporphyrinogen III oxidase [Candidatus Albibeggiatoa sp. nov. NOAA]|uniref:oxygen-independent coproporphyrinogen III oxidase n=1 Tax=Candidatus Albibeggiatoa sp. nov. NOAA TaxID=3162724 RepID=UPI0032F0FB95|nr:oxygen-independent coproporphyrinogen III oxidase [Thiotrichaceae bacterium]
MQQTTVFDLDLIQRYDKAGPRYTSYPTAVQFHEGFASKEYIEYAKNSNVDNAPLSLYFHIPFCDTVCFYCACNKVATKNHQLAVEYLQRLLKEIELQAALFDKQRPVTQLHWGGGTPTFLNLDEMWQLMDTTRQHFNLLDDDTGEYSIEIDPREADANTIKLLRELGFNRMSLGVQDFDPKVQKAVNRIQTEAETFAVLEAARKEGFRSISIDLIYGLPHQTQDSFKTTLDKVLQVEPERLSIFNYAHLPTLFKPQRRINETDLPTPAQKLDVLQMTINYLLDAGYVYIGMDHFAKPDDELAVAQRNGTLYRNFQGYATHADCDLVAMGSTSISKVGASYSQNVKTLEEYYARIDNNELAVFRGIALNEDDVLRREVITQLICHFGLSIPNIEKQFNIDFKQYFAQEWTELDKLQQDGLITYDDQMIEILPAGRLLVRNICMVFDIYLRQAKEQRFSKVI